MSKRKKVGAIFLLLGILLASVAISFSFLQPEILTSPVTSTTIFRFLGAQDPTINTHQKVVYGFLPYWNLTKTELQPELTTLAYFSLTIGSDGSILTKTSDGPDIGFQRWSSESLLSLMSLQHQRGKKVDLVFTQFDNDDIARFLTNDRSQQKFIDSLDSILLAAPIDGINIDIEYSGEITPGVRNGMTKFLKTLDQSLNKRNPKIQLSVDLYSSAANDQNIWSISEIHHSVDYIIIMAYDFHRKSSPLAGPVAPLFGGKKLWDSDITQHLKQFLTVIPKEKILLGVPFYGYEWQTTSRDSQAQTYPDTGATASIERVQELLAQKDQLHVEEKWNEEALSPYLTYQKNRLTYEIYYENSRSMSYKLDLINQLQLGGVAIWALGYEGNSRDLWEVIGRKL